MALACHGLVVNVQTTRATGTAGRDATATMPGEIEVGTQRATIGADKAHNTRSFVQACRDIDVTPHVGPTWHVAMRPWAGATPEIEAPGSLQAASTLALSSMLWRRRKPDLECIGVHQSNRWTPSSRSNRRQTRWEGWTLTPGKRRRQLV